MIKAGVIGWPIEQSKSPMIHGHWLEKHNISGSYEKIALAAEDFTDGVKALINKGYAGANVTVPHKEAALKLADTLSDAAEKIGAANTLVFNDDKIHADNTDGYGFLTNLISGAPDWNAASGPALVLGAGGAARAIIFALLDAGISEIILANRTRARAESLANHFGRKIMVANWEDISDAAAGVGLIVNTTSLGMIGQPMLEIDLSKIQPNTVVNDIVYNPIETKLLSDAKSHGAKPVAGLGMLLHQAVPGFEAWFGTRPTVDEALYKKIVETL